MAKGFDRRALLRGGCAFLTVGCAGSPAGTSPTADATGDTGTTDTGTVPTGGDYPCGQGIDGSGGGWTTLSLAEYPDLADVGGWYGVTVGGTAVVVAHVTEGCYAAITRACAHEGAAIDYRPDRGQFVCPLHGAIYAPDGQKVAGPQAGGLPVHPCGRVGDAVLVKL